MAKLSIEQIQVGTRVREDTGDIGEIAESMRRYGLIHPIVVDAQNRLVAGGRRLEAAKHLGWREIEVRYLGELSEAERRMIEVRRTFGART
ncbi:MAG: ParB N-terminal domain-containing protein [Alicyclobacillaceae bacterium]|nr:ParB N-terminal domain-containing protein [Alicyclobacillaceae bacterium]